MTTQSDDKTENALSQARAQLESVKEMVAALDKAVREDDDRAREDAEQAINEDPLSVEIRSGWHVPGQFEEAVEYRILLCTGGPAVQIIGDLGDHNEPKTAILQCQDWFTPWTNVPITNEEQDALLAYARTFYFEEC